MSSQPRPTDLAKYQARLGELTAAREVFRAQHDDHKVQALNRQIMAQTKWIKRALTQATE
jgi:hypothetical protein